MGRMNWTRASKEQRIRDHGHEPLAPSDRTVGPDGRLTPKELSPPKTVAQKTKPRAKPSGSRHGAGGVHAARVTTGPSRTAAAGKPAPSPGRATRELEAHRKAKDTPVFGCTFNTVVRTKPGKASKSKGAVKPNTSPKSAVPKKPKPVAKTAAEIAAAAEKRNTARMRSLHDYRTQSAARLAAMSPEQRAAHETKQAKALDARLRGVVVEHKGGLATGKKPGSKVQR